VTARNPLILSGVVLAGANLPPLTDDLGLPTGEDGILTAEEVVNLDLRGTELVVLSACETGLGRSGGGEGVYGLQRAFHLAGARNVIASLWKVSDQATAALMRLFYHKLWIEKKPPIEALREAQLAIYYHPEQIKYLATTRGPNFKKTVKLVDGGRRNEPTERSPTRHWAAFTLSGPGR
jgi:CHAT domain-containing protein